MTQATQEPLSTRPVPGEPLDRPEIWRRAASGTATIGVRGLLVRVIQLAGTIVLARLLAPSDFGVLAFGLTVLSFAIFFSDLGLGAALVRRREPPERAELASLLGLQLSVSCAVVIVVAAFAPLGRTAQLTAVIVAAMPILAVRAPSVVLLERAILFGPVALAEVAESAAFFLWAVAGVLIGFGVWALATAAIVRAVVGTSFLLARTPHRVLRPEFSIARIRGMVAFGVKYQAAGVATLMRDQGLNVGIAAIAGVGVLGLWSVASAVLQIPFLVFSALWRVGYPTMARLVSKGEDLAPVLERLAAAVAVAAGLILCPLIGAGPALIPGLLGDRWMDAAYVILPAGIGLLFSAPISVASVAFLYAVGDAMTPLRMLVLEAAVWFSVTLPLLSVIGVGAVGLGWLAGCVVEVVVLLRGVSRRSSARLLPSIAFPAGAAAAVSVAAWVLSWQLIHGLPSSLAMGGAAEITFVLALAVFRWRLVMDGVALVRRFARPSAAPAQVA